MLEIFVICMCADRPETFGRKYSLVAHCRQNNLPTECHRHRVTGSKAYRSGRVTGQRFKPGSISGANNSESIWSLHIARLSHTALEC